jgi:hypothetical protein
MLVVASAALTACDVVVTSLNAKGKAEDTWSRTYPITANGQVEIVNLNGGIDVVGGEGTQVEVVAERTARAATDDVAREFLKQVEIREEVNADRVRLETKVPSNPEGKRAEIRYRVKVPATVSVRVTDVNGAVEVTGIKGALKAETTNGGVRGRDLSGAVEATTTNGGIKLAFASLASGGIRAETTNGGVDVTIPASAKADVKLSCTNGGISVDGLKLEGGESSRRRVEGRLNGGGPSVSLETVNGGIRFSGK